MIVLNGALFAETDAELAENNECVGTATRFDRQIVLKNRAGERIGVVNKYGCVLRATLMADGRYWYNFARIKELGDGDYSLKQQRLDVTAAACRVQYDARSGQDVYWFKAD